MTTAKIFRLVDDFTAAYIKFNGREPRTLEELAIALANNEHGRRLAEIKAMRSRLAMLDDFLPELAARGCKIWPRDIHSSDRGKTLRLYPALFTIDDKLRAALIELGFREIERTDHLGRHDTVKLQHGRWLIIAIDAPKPEVAA